MMSADSKLIKTLPSGFLIKTEKGVARMFSTFQLFPARNIAIDSEVGGAVDEHVPNVTLLCI